MGKRIVAVGTGTNGSCISADLIRAGNDVTMIDQWPAHVETMRRDGLRISAPDEEIHDRVDSHHICDLCTLNRTFDIAFIVVKAYDTRWAAELIKPYLTPDAVVVGIQNAMTANDIAEIVGPSLASEMFEPGKVKRSIPRARTWFGLGALDPSMEPRVAEIEAILPEVGRVSRCENILSAKWIKLIVNSMAMGPQALLGLNGSEAVKLPGMREIMLKCGEEALAAGRSQGYGIEPIFGLKREEFEGSNQLLEMLLDKIQAAVGTTAKDTVTQDHLKGRYSEVDLINGAVVAENARHGRASPYNAMIAEVTQRLHAGELKPEPGNLEIIRATLDRHLAE